MTESSFPVTDLPSVLPCFLVLDPVLPPLQTSVSGQYPRERNSPLFLPAMATLKYIPFCFTTTCWLHCLPWRVQFNPECWAGGTRPSSQEFWWRWLPWEKCPGKFRWDLHINQYYISDGREQWEKKTHLLSVQGSLSQESRVSPSGNVPSFYKTFTQVRKPVFSSSPQHAFTHCWYLLDWIGTVT